MPVLREDYERAEKFLSPQAHGLIYKTSILPHRIDGTKFWYCREDREGRRYLSVDVFNNQVRDLFDHAKLAAGLSQATGEHLKPSALLLENVEVVGGTIRLEYHGRSWVYEKTAGILREAKKKWDHVGIESPDGNHLAFVKSHNLFVESADGHLEQLTTDGEEFCGYGESPESNCTTITDRVLGRVRPPVAIWSPDSNKILTHLLDQRAVKELYLIQIQTNGTVYSRPVLQRYKYPLVGDSELATAAIHIFDVQRGTAVKADCNPEQVVYLTPIELKLAWWNAKSTHVYLIHRDRGERRLLLYRIDAQNGGVQRLIEETGDTQIEPNLVIEPIFYFDNTPNVAEFSDGSELVWFSERDGWGHLYLYDGVKGLLRRQLTKGQYVVRNVLHVDRCNRIIYFTASGKEVGRDPYYRHLYRIWVDRESSEPEILTPEDGDHEIWFPPDGGYFVDTFSRVDTPPITLLRRSDGSLIRMLEEADIGGLTKLGWKPPERFVAKARDGRTDIYGVIYRPTSFDPAKKYPVIDDIYPGPSIIRSAKSFDPDPHGRVWFWHPQAVAELGFVVVTIDGLGTPFRSKKLHDFAYGRFEEVCGIEDHIAALNQLARTHQYLDLTRVGAYGHSGGGYATARAILSHPEFYKAGVSSSGNHDQRGYVAMFGEKYQGLLDEADYDSQSNFSLAGNLKGKLLLVHGDMDDNVHPSLTLMLASALIRANKDFELLIMPGRNHNLWTDPYFLRRRWDFFVRNLLGEEPPEYAIGELPSEDPFLAKRMN